jgi:uncharacterized membrane protein (UPF0127 family)
MAQLLNCADGTVVASWVTLCDTGWTRTRGLIGTRRLEPGHVFWIAGCNAIHTFFMTMTIDVAFLDESLCVVRLVHAMPPFQVRLPVRGARSVIEGAVGMIESGHLQVGTGLAYRP